ncbi:hypothetical protein K488DRAFT_37100, partial [Vararia minispora EC-137]
MAPTFLQAVTVLLLTSVAHVQAETHTIRFDNQCGQGTPILILGGQIVSNGSEYSTSGNALSGIAYVGECGFNGEGCSLIEFTLNNPICVGCGSSADISLIPPHAFNVPTTFSYFNGCDGQGATCNSATCNTAFFKSDDNQVQVGCQTDNVGLLVSFCTEGSSSASASSATPSSNEPTIFRTPVVTPQSATPTT